MKQWPERTAASRRLMLNRRLDPRSINQSPVGGYLLTALFR
jgi:hypothetical protein